MEKIDFLAIGDITIDAFIKIKEASLNCDINHKHCKICFDFAQKVPYENVFIVKAVGNSPNAAVSARRLGLNSAIITNIGDDQNGKDCLETLEASGVNTNYVLTQSGKKTNYHYVLWYEDERTILVKHEEYDYRMPENLEAPKWIYLSSIGENSIAYHHQITDYLSKNKETKLTFQPGTFQIKLGYEKLKDLYAQTEIFFCNVEEARLILNEPNAEIKTLLKEMRNLGPKIVSITDGPKGAYVIANDQSWFMPIYPDPKEPLERTGAGDSYASTFTSAIILEKSIEEALRWAMVNPTSVVQHIGAQEGLLSKEELEKWLSKAPLNFLAKKI